MPAMAGAAQVVTGTMLLQQSARTVIVLVKVRFFTDAKGEPPTARKDEGVVARRHTHTLCGPASLEKTHTCNPNPVCHESHPLWFWNPSLCTTFP